MAKLAYAAGARSPVTGRLHEQLTDLRILLARKDAELEHLEAQLAEALAGQNAMQPDLQASAEVGSAYNLAVV